MADEKCVRDPRHDCFGLEAAARLEGRIKALEDWQQDSKKFHNSFYDWQREQIARDAKLDEQLSNMDKNIEKLLAKQEEQTAKPGRRFLIIRYEPGQRQLPPPARSIRCLRPLRLNAEGALSKQHTSAQRAITSYIIRNRRSSRIFERSYQS